MKLNKTFNRFSVICLIANTLSASVGEKDKTHLEAMAWAYGAGTENLQLSDEEKEILIQGFNEAVGSEMSTETITSLNKKVDRFPSFRLSELNTAKKKAIEKQRNLELLAAQQAITEDRNRVLATFSSENAVQRQAKGIIYDLALQPGTKLREKMFSPEKVINYYYPKLAPDPRVLEQEINRLSAQLTPRTAIIYGSNIENLKARRIVSKMLSQSAPENTDWELIKNTIENDIRSNELIPTGSIEAAQLLDFEEFYRHYYEEGLKRDTSLMSRGNISEENRPAFAEHYANTITTYIRRHGLSPRIMTKAMSLALQNWRN